MSHQDGIAGNWTDLPTEFLSQNSEDRFVENCARECHVQNRSVGDQILEVAVEFVAEETQPDHERVEENSETVEDYVKILATNVVV